jgi:hypothetical protein
MKLASTSPADTTARLFDLELWKGGVYAVAIAALDTAGFTTTRPWRIHGTTTINLAAAEYIDIRAEQNIIAGNISSINSAGNNFVDIEEL